MGGRKSMGLVFACVVVFLFFWALIHGGTRHNDKYDD